MLLGVLKAISIVIILTIAYILYKKYVALRRSKQKKFSSANPQKPDLEIIEHKAININYFNYIIGIIKNNSSKTYEYVEVKIGIYSDHELMGTTMASANGLKPGEKWSFQAPVLEQGEYKYKFISVSGN